MRLPPEIAAELRQDAQIALALARTTIGRQQPNESWFQPEWWFDFANRTGKAKDSNSGLDPDHPLLTWNGGLIRRYATLFPRLGQETQYHALSSHPNGGDPIVFFPTFTGNSRPIFSGPIDATTLVAETTLGAVTPKNRPAGTLLQADVQTALAAEDMLLVNETRGGARSWLFRQVGPTTFDLSQPLTASTLDLIPPVEVDTFAPGDVCQIFAPWQVNFVSCLPVIADIGPAAQNFSLVHQLAGFSTPGAALGLNAAFWGQRLALLDCISFRRIILAQSSLFGNALLFNTPTRAGVVGGPAQSIDGVQTGLWLLGGYTRLSADEPQVLDLDLIVFSPLGVGQLRGGAVGLVYVDGGVTLQVANEVNVAPNQAATAALWGPGALDVREQGRVTLSDTAASQLLLSGGLRINGQSSAFSATLAQPSVLNANVPITALALDAPAGIAGFGTLGAFVPGGGGISKLT